MLHQTRLAPEQHSPHSAVRENTGTTYKGISLPAVSPLKERPVPNRFMSPVSSPVAERNQPSTPFNIQLRSGNNQAVQPAQRVSGAVIQRITIINSKLSYGWGNNEKEISTGDLFYIVKRSRNYEEDRINLGEDEDYWILISDVISGVENALDEAGEEGDDDEVAKLNLILEYLNNSGTLVESPPPVAPKKPVVPPKSIPVKKAPEKRKLEEGSDKKPPKKPVVKAPVKVPVKAPAKAPAKVTSEKEPAKEKDKEKSKRRKKPVVKKQRTDTEKFVPKPIRDFGIKKDEDTDYGHDKGKNRVFLTKAPDEVLGLLGESGKLIKEKEFEGIGKGGEKPDPRYVDFVNVIDKILNDLEKNAIDTSLAERAIKILNEFLYVLHDFKYRVRYKNRLVEEDVEHSRTKEIEKCRQQIEVLNGLVQNIVKTDPDKRQLLVEQAKFFFNITFGGFAVSGSLHPGDMFGGPLDVNHVKPKSLFTRQHYKAAFKRTEKIRKETNKGKDDTDFDESYFAKGLLTVSKHAADKYGRKGSSPDEVRDFLKSKGIGRKNIKRLQTIAEEESETLKEEGEFSDYLGDSDTDDEGAKGAREKYVPRKEDSIEAFAKKTGPYLFTSADYAKQINETILLRQHQLNKREKPRVTRLIGLVKEQRGKELQDLAFIASNSKTKISDKLTRQLTTINEMLKACEAVKSRKAYKRVTKGKTPKSEKGAKPTRAKKTKTPEKVTILKTTEDILNSWGRTDVVNSNETLKNQKLLKKADIDIVIKVLTGLKKEYESVDFSTFFKQFAASGKEYEYNQRQKFTFLEERRSRREELLQAFLDSLNEVEEQEDEEDPRADQSHHASEYIYAGRKELQKKDRADKSWFNVVTNPGGGDCLLHALAGETLPFDRVLTLRRNIAHAAGETAPVTISGSVIYQSLHQSGYLTEEIEESLQSRHRVSREAYQQLIKVPGLYGGEEEIQAYCHLEGNPDTVYIITHEGELRSVTNEGSQTVMRLSVDGEVAFREAVAGYLRNAELVLFKSANHWEKVVGIKE